MLSESKITELQKVFEKHDEVLFAYLFGSVAKNEEGPLSDVDIAVYLDCEKNQVFDLKLELNSQIPIMDKEFDLVVLNEAKLSMQHEIINGKVIYCKDNDKRVEVETSIMNRYLDMKPFYQEYAQKNLEKTAREGLT